MKALSLFTGIGGLDIPADVKEKYLTVFTYWRRKMVWVEVENETS